ncbi:unnamed protein product [Acidithrix sp. C25]|nr:unnamed protein product [Acidithrix sp. C25]
MGDRLVMGPKRQMRSIQNWWAKQDSNDGCSSSDLFFGDFRCVNLTAF